MVRRYSFLVGRELTFDSQTFKVKGLKTHWYRDPATVDIVLVAADGKLTVMEFTAFHQVWMSSVV